MFTFKQSLLYTTSCASETTKYFVGKFLHRRQLANRYRKVLGNKIRPVLVENQDSVKMFAKLSQHDDYPET